MLQLSDETTDGVEELQKHPEKLLRVVLSVIEGDMCVMAHGMQASMLCLNSSQRGR
jgi:hypothetical protein